MISWNPEGRDWSHASVVFYITDGMVHVADPNIPDPNETVRVIPESEFYSMWGEAWSNYIVRRVAMAIDREITPDGRQKQAGRTARARPSRILLREWAQWLKRNDYTIENDDDAFDGAFDVACGADALDEWDECDVEFARELAYELLKAEGKPYGDDLWGDKTAASPARVAHRALKGQR